MPIVRCSVQVEGSETEDVLPDCSIGLGTCAPAASARLETAERFDALWDQEETHLPLSGEVIAAIDKHRKRLAV